MSRAPIVVRLSAALVALVCIHRPLPAQVTGDMLERFTQRSRAAEAAGLADAFVGITSNGAPTTGLFPMRSTGVSTAPVRTAAQSFLASLTGLQRTRTVFGVDDPEWRKWMNQHFYVRQGVSFAELSESQRTAALGLLQSSLSAKGLKLTRDIMRLNHTLGELNGNDFEQYGEWLYHLTLMGEPSATEPWGWQLDGHHLIINYFVLGDQVVMTPLFVGSEPVTALAGKFAGTSILQEEQNAGLAMVNALTDAQRATAVLTVSKTGNNNLTEAFKDNAVLDYAGVRGSELTTNQQRRLLDLMELYVSNLREDQAHVHMSDVEQHLDQTYFAWIGETSDDAVFYYRIHSPVILIEFDHQRPANLRQLYGRDPVRQHIHAVVRTPNGNDYGKDLLRQHYAEHPHPE